MAQRGNGTPSEQGSSLIVGRAEWQWFGNSGHLIVGRDCRFHLATRVGPWWVSTVGEYWPDSRVREITASVRGINPPADLQGDSLESWWLKNVEFRYSSSSSHDGGLPSGRAAHFSHIA